MNSIILNTTALLAVLNFTQQCTKNKLDFAANETSKTTFEVVKNVLLANFVADIFSKNNLLGKCLICATTGLYVSNNFEQIKNSLSKDFDEASKLTKGIAPNMQKINIAFSDVYKAAIAGIIFTGTAVSIANSAMSK